MGTAGELMWLQCRVCLGTQDRFSVTLFSGRWKKDQENPIVKQESGCGFRKALGTDSRIDSLEAELGGDLTGDSSEPGCFSKASLFIFKTAILR